MSDELEKELHRLTPLPPSRALEERIAAELHYTPPARGATSPLSDSLLRSLVSLAVAAAVLIVFLLATDGQSSSAPPANVSSVASGSLSIADTPRSSSPSCPSRSRRYRRPQLIRNDRPIRAKVSS